MAKRKVKIKGASKNNLGNTLYISVLPEEIEFKLSISFGSF